MDDQSTPSKFPLPWSRFLPRCRTPFFSLLFFTSCRSKRRAFIVQRRAYPAETNDQAYKVGSKKHQVPSLKLIYVTIIFNNAKKARIIQSRVMVNFLRAVSLLGFTLAVGMSLSSLLSYSFLFFFFFFFFTVTSFIFFFSFSPSLDERRTTADGSTSHLTSLDRPVDREPSFYLSRVPYTSLP